MGKSQDERPDSQTLTREQLVELVRKLERVVDAQRAEIDRVRIENERLRREIERLRREDKRQAAPFARLKPKVNPKRPGRKPGQGRFARREPPASDEVSRRVEVPEPTACPCGGGLEMVGHEEASNTDLPPDPRPEVTLFHVPVCRCRKCGRTVRGRHPDLAPDQFGATAHRVGDRAMAAAHALHYGVGVPVQQVPAILQELGGLTITQSAITQDALRRAEGDLAADYQELRRSMQHQPVVHTDDTGWRVAGKAAQMMTFATPGGETVYQIRAQHRNEEVREILPGDYQGTMVTDRGRSYDAKEFEGVKQQKCLFHLYRSIDEVLETKTGAARGLGEKLKAELKSGHKLWRAYRAGEPLPRLWRVKAKRVQEELEGLLRPRTMRDRDNQRLLDELGWHNDQGNLTRFLEDPAVAPTNNLAERELRPAVKARKVSQCSKNWRGARARECHLSITRTLRRKTRGSLVAALREKFRAASHQHRGPP